MVFVDQGLGTGVDEKKDAGDPSLKWNKGISSALLIPGRPAMSRLLQGHFILSLQSKLYRGIHGVNPSPFNHNIKNNTSFLKFMLLFSF